MFFKIQKRLRWGVPVLIGALWLNDASWASSVVTAIDFNGMSEAPEIKVQGDAPFVAEVIRGSTSQEILISLKGVRFAQAASQSLDTSSLGTLVSLIQPFNPVKEGDDATVLVRLTEPGIPKFVQKGNTLSVRVFKDPAGDQKSTPASSDQKSNSNSPGEPRAGADASAAGVGDVASKIDRLAELMASQADKKFTGKLISLKLRDANISDVFQLIGDASGFNIILGKDVAGKISLSLEEVPWDQALDVVLRTMELGAERSNNVLRIVTLKNMTAQKEQEMAASNLLKQSTPKITRVFPISYATIKDLVGALQKFSNNASAGAGAAQSTGGDASFIQADDRTNSVIIHDIPKNLDQMKRLIEILDTQTPQVMIEAKVVEASESFSKNLSGNLGVGDSQIAAFGSFAGGNPIDSLIGTPGVFATGSAISTATAGSKGASANGTFGFSPSLSFLSSTLRLNAILGIGESESQVKIVATPKLVVMNRQNAKITSSTPVLTPTITQTAAGAAPNVVVTPANLSLDVTPTVTNDASILMDLKVQKDVPVSLAGGNAVGQRNINTQVLVENGTTLVIGGIYTLNSNHSSTGFPILRSIPLIGWLFGSEAGTEDRAELLIFITPRILNSKEIFSGGAS
jgi:type IV pilus assembly protein PilQ